MSLLEVVPAELLALRQWVCWRREGAKQTKVPLTAAGTRAGSNRHSDWSSFDVAQANAQRYDGVGFMISAGDPYCGIDLDGCLEEGRVKEWAEPIIDLLRGFAYGEVSPSGKGIKFLVRGEKPMWAMCVHQFSTSAKEQLECYDRGRFWTVTGRVAAGFESIADDGQYAVDRITEEYLKPRPVESCFVSWNGFNGTDLVERAAAYVDNARQGTIGNLRNSAFSLAGHLWSFRDELGGRLSRDEIVTLVRLWNFRNVDQLRDDEVIEAVDNSEKNGSPREIKPANVIHIDSGTGIDLTGILGAQPRVAGEVEPSHAELADDKEPEMPYFPDVELLERTPLPKYLQLAYDYSEVNSAPFLPEGAIAGLLSLFASILGRKVETTRRTRTNLMTFLLAPSGSGKNSQRSCNKDLLVAANLLQLIGPERVGSHQGVVSALQDEPRCLMQLDEGGYLLKAITDNRSHLKTLPPVLMHLYSDSSTTWKGDAVADKRRVAVIHHPNLVIYSTTTCEAVFSCLTRELLLDGFFNRWLFVNSVRFPTKIPEPIRIEPPPELLNWMRAWATLRTTNNNLEGSGVDIPQPLVVRYTQEASEAAEQYEEKVRTTSQSESEIKKATWVRAPEKVAKICLILACARCMPTDTPLITLNDFNWAKSYVNYSTRFISWAIEERTSQGVWSEIKQRVLDKIDGEMTRSQVTRRTQFLRNAKERREILQDLIDADCVQFDTVRNVFVKKRGRV